MNRHTPPHTITLVLAAAVGAMATNTFLPSLPGMAREFAVPYATVGLLVSVFLAANAVLQLVIGPLSDRYGRRPVMVGALAVFVASTFASLFATDMATLLSLRVLQASSAAGMALSRAIVRDTGDTEGAASRIGYITMGMTVAPMIGPMIGGALDGTFGWRGSFGVMLAVGVAALAAVWFDLGETNDNPSDGFARQFKAWPRLLKSLPFWSLALTSGFTGGVYFAFLGGGPAVASNLLAMTPGEFGAMLVFIGIGYMAGNFISGRFSRRIGISGMMFAGNLVNALGILIAGGLAFAGATHPLALFMPLVFLGLGNGLTLPSAGAGLVSIVPELAGSASGLGGALQIAVSAVMSVVAGIVVGSGETALPLLALMLASTLAALACTALARWG
ncbi:MAG: multidrug effflux MFS transporter, partial [Rhizobiaceae bacterium]